MKSENLIKQQSLEKNALAQKMKSEFEEMAKVKQVEIEKIATKYKNKKFDLETKQGKGKNIYDNENLLKANIFSSNLINYSNSDSIVNSMNKSLNRSNKVPSISDSKMKEINPISKKIDFKGVDNFNYEKKSAEAFVSNGISSDCKNYKKSGNFAFNKSSKKSFNNGRIGSSKQKPEMIRNLQYSSAQN